VRDFVSKLLVKNPQQRMTAAEALLHPWILEVRKSALNLDESRVLLRKTSEIRRNKKNASFDVVHV